MRNACRWHAIHLPSGFPRAHPHRKRPSRARQPCPQHRQSHRRILRRRPRRFQRHRGRRFPSDARHSRRLARLSDTAPAGPPRTTRHSAWRSTPRSNGSPKPFIPHAGASYVQTTEIELHPGASLLFFEWLAPGRVAKGEVFAYQNLRWELDLRVDGNSSPASDTISVRKTTVSSPSARFSRRSLSLRVCRRGHDETLASRRTRRSSERRRPPRSRSAA